MWRRRKIKDRLKTMYAQTNIRRVRGPEIFRKSQQGYVPRLIKALTGRHFCSCALPHRGCLYSYKDIKTDLNNIASILKFMYIFAFVFKPTRSPYFTNIVLLQIVKFIVHLSVSTVLFFEKLD